MFNILLSTTLTACGEIRNKITYATKESTVGLERKEMVGEGEIRVYRNRTGRRLCFRIAHNNRNKLLIKMN